MEIQLTEISPSLVALAMGFGLMFFSIFRKHELVYLAIIASWFVVYADNTTPNFELIQIPAMLVMIWAGYEIFKLRVPKR